VFSPERFPRRVPLLGRRLPHQGEDYISLAPGGGQFLIDRCFAGVDRCLRLLRPQRAGAITTVRNVSLNLDYILAKGIDFEADYRIPVGDGNNLQLHGIATYVDTLKSVSFGDAVDRAGQTGNTVGLAAPHWMLNGTATFAAPRWSVTLQGASSTAGSTTPSGSGPKTRAMQRRCQQHQRQPRRRARST
jgi:outer membrane receptor protein involved in Fe transport